MKILALDFDGVICNSLLECLINSYNSFNIVGETLAKRLYKLEQIAQTEVETFRRFRPLVRVAKEYYALWLLIRKHQSIDPRKSIREQARVTDHKLEEFNSIFYAERKVWLDKDAKSWFRYNPLYDGMKKALFKILDKENVFIVSSKNAWAIKAILGYNEMSVADGKILGSDSGMDKDALFHQLSQRHSIRFSNIIFLDDNLSNLLTAKDMGISVFFASWGYSMESEKKQIYEMGIPAVALEDFGEWAVEEI
ncbi:MAG: hypothetical protein LWX51_09270 [Deltaproteobacteria bacterium]|jgi:phosphoglycolate phosphatase-like HAD superfamily hydrolase|nr:hypothetical protein [Deltaproteobacteria bacterium]